ncbi:MAG: DUF6515 family protein [Candidatus Auribacterota bacterium]
MIRSIMKKTVSVVSAVVFLIPVASSQTFAQHHGGHHGYHHRGHYRWHDNHWWIGDTILAGGLVLGSIIDALPPHHKVVYVKEAPYYYDGTYYFRRIDDGYVVVEDPTIVVHPSTPVVVTPAPNVIVKQPEPEIVTINIPNDNGSFTPVVLIKKGDGYIGPQGEYYDGNPTVDQLRALYGN